MTSGGERITHIFVGKLISGQKEMGGKSGAAAENCRKPADAMQSVATRLAEN